MGRIARKPPSALRIPPARFSRGFYQPRPTRFAEWLLRHFGRLYLRIAQGTTELRIINPEPLHRAFHSFYNGESRLIVLFRHVEVADGPAVMSALTGDLWRIDRSKRWRSRAGIKGPRLPRKPHSYFLYGKDVLNWAGAGARWVFPRLGGIPVVNTRLDRSSHEAIRETIVRGAHPLALAPEGQVTYQMFRVSELAAGVGTMANWVEQDLVAAARGGGAGEAAEVTAAGTTGTAGAEQALSEDGPESGVVILPMAIGYHLARDHNKLLHRVLDALERELGVVIDRSRGNVSALLNATQLLFDWLELSYRKAYPSVFEDIPARTEEAHGEATDIDALSERGSLLCDRILRCAELGVPSNGDDTVFRRLFAVRYRAVDFLYPEARDPRKLPPVSRAWANGRTIDAMAIDRHAQIVDTLMYVEPDYLRGTPNLLRQAEYALNLLDVTNRVAGGNIDSRYSPGRKRARLLIGDPINAGLLFRDPDLSPRAAIATLNDKVLAAFERLVDDLEGVMMREQSD